MFDSAKLEGEDTHPGTEEYVPSPLKRLVFPNIHCADIAEFIKEIVPTEFLKLQKSYSSAKSSSDTGTKVEGNKQFDITDCSGVTDSPQGSTHASKIATRAVRAVRAVCIVAILVSISQTFVPNRTAKSLIGMHDGLG
jgi:hypothetical protein